MQSNFDFLPAELADCAAIARKAERYTLSEPEMSALFCRKALEKFVTLMYEGDARLTHRLPADPKERNLFALTSHPAFRGLLSNALNQQIHLLRKYGNHSAHAGSLPITTTESTTSLKALYGFAAWFAQLYAGVTAVPAFDESLLPAGQADASPAEKAALLAELAQNQLQVQVRDELLQARAAEIRQLREALERRNAPLRRYTGVLSEAETRRLFIDVLLREAGWNPDGPHVREFAITPDDRADYVLWDDDGLPLAVIEAKRTSVDKEAGRAQAKRYADALEKRYGHRPFIYYTNGFQTAFWDDTRYVPRPAQGFHKQSELQLLVNRRRDRLPLGSQSVNDAIADRYYQKNAIKAVSEHFEKGHRKALVVMATGSGKTRTAAALVDVLVRAGWVKRVLFLADRKSLVRQAYANFKRDLPSLTGVNLLEEPVTAHTRIVFSTYQTIMNRIDKDMEQEVRFFGIGHFDLVIIDEAHRSIYNKYQALFEYFDALLLGLTATPKAETEIDTYNFFDLPSHDPTYSYDLEQAVGDGYLVPYQGLSVPMKFPRNGIKYSELSPEEQERYEETFQEALGYVPEGIDAGALNAWLFNQDTIDKVLNHLMDKGQRIEGGDKLGKTIIFAKSKEHAEFIVKRFNVLYPEHAGHFCLRIDYSVSDADKLITAFGNEHKTDFQVAVSVDMLDTGIDIPEVLNLVFFKRVLSKSKFWQMIGRGTRLRENLFAPPEPEDKTRYTTYRKNPKHKQFFYIFDFCENFEFFETNPHTTEGALTKTLSELIFMAKVRLARTIGADACAEEQAYRTQLLEGLHQSVLALREDSFVVRRVLPQVLKYKDPGIWQALDEADVRELAKHIAPLVKDAAAREDVRRFDYLMLQTQWAHYGKDASATGFVQSVRKIARGLQKKGSVAAVSEKMSLIAAVAGEEYWKTATLTQLERVRTELRQLVSLLDKETQPVVYTDFEDQITGAVKEFRALPGYVNSEVYKERVEQIVRLHADQLAIRKLQHNMPITEGDLNQLEKFLFEGAEFDSRESFVQVLGEKPLGVFVRSLLGLDIQAAKAAFSELMNGVQLTYAQSTFLNTIINYLNQNGTIDSSLLYQSPFTDIDVEGITGVFGEEEAGRIIQIINRVNNNALAG